MLWIGIGLMPIRDPDPNFHVDADPDPNWHKNDVASHADPTPSFTHVGKSVFYTFCHFIVSLQCFVFLISVKCVIIFSILNTILKFSGKKFSV
jgi:hypothetical protein